MLGLSAGNSSYHRTTDSVFIYWPVPPQALRAPSTQRRSGRAHEPSVRCGRVHHQHDHHAHLQEQPRQQAKAPPRLHRYRGPKLCRGAGKPRPLDEAGAAPRARQLRRRRRPATRLSPKGVVGPVGSR